MEELVHKILHLSPTRLARLASELMGPSEAGIWLELPGIFQQLLRTRVVAELETLDPRLVGKLAAVSRICEMTFSDLFHCHEPPLTALQAVMEFAEAGVLLGTTHLPLDIYRAVYFACACVALVRYQKCIGSLSIDRLRDSFEWARAQPWLDQDTRKLLREGLRAIERTMSNPQASLADQSQHGSDSESPGP